MAKGWAKSPSQSGKKSLIFSTLNQNWNNFISTSRNDIDLIFGAKWCSSVILYKFIGFEKGWQKGWQLWITEFAQSSKFVKIIQFQIFFAYIEWAVPATPFECHPFCINYWHIRKRGGKRKAYRDNWKDLVEDAFEIEKEASTNL